MSGACGDKLVQLFFSSGGFMIMLFIHGAASAAAAASFNVFKSKLPSAVFYNELQPPEETLSHTDSSALFLQESLLEEGGGDKTFYGSDEDEDEDEEEKEKKAEAQAMAKRKPYVMDPDHRLLLRNTKPLLQSRNAAVSTLPNKTRFTSAKHTQP